jgi:putative sterol carrier protein
MKAKPAAILFVTSFFPVAIFKILARVGEITPGRVKVAVVTGLILAVAQFLLSRRFLKHTTYLEKAFLGFLGVGTAWIFLTPPQASSLFVHHSTSLLYLVLFLTTLLPQLFGYDPFTYSIAKMWYPKTVWDTPQFRTINLHITYFWSAIFLLATLSCWLGQEKPLFSVVLPLLFILGIGLPFSRKYPEYYLKREFAVIPLDSSAFPNTARELVLRMPQSFNGQAVPDLKADIQFDLSGEGGGKMILSIADGRCSVREGEAPHPTLTIISPGDVWLKMARGEINRPKALMDGLFKIEGDINLLLKMGELFQPPAKADSESFPSKGKGR